MLLTLLLAAQVAATPPAPAPRGLLSYEDYPPEALRKGQQGDVRVQLTVSDEGRATDCKVVESSGSKALDDRTCQIMLDRARFSAALDPTGHPVGSKFTTPVIRWRIQ